MSFQNILKTGYSLDWRAQSHNGNVNGKVSQLMNFFKKQISKKFRNLNFKTFRVNGMVVSKWVGGHGERSLRPWEGEDGFSLKSAVAKYFSVLFAEQDSGVHYACSNVYVFYKSSKSDSATNYDVLQIWGDRRTSMSNVFSVQRWSFTCQH